MKRELGFSKENGSKENENSMNLNSEAEIEVIDVDSCGNLENKEVEERSENEERVRVSNFSEENASKEYENSMNLHPGTEIEVIDVDSYGNLEDKEVKERSMNESEGHFSGEKLGNARTFWGKNPPRIKKRNKKQEWNAEFIEDDDDLYMDTVNGELSEEDLEEKEGMEPNRASLPATYYDTLKRVRGNAWKRRIDAQRKRYNLEIARSRAAQFAQGQENVSNNEMPLTEHVPEIQDWIGLFSAAMKVIEDQQLKLKFPQLNSNWMPTKNRSFTRPSWLVPSLQDLCVREFCKNAEEIISMNAEEPPDELRNKICQSLCDSRKMNFRMLELLVGTRPSEIQLKDCSWITEEQLEIILKGCTTDHLRVLQLDLCGPCISDYVLRDNLARFHALHTISLRGACRLTDNGLNFLVTSVPLRSINLGQCSLLTSAAINYLADNLGSSLRALYINDCQSIDAMLILPALKRLKELEVLSVAGIQTVCDNFVRELIPVCGPNMKELIFSDCGKLTDASLKVIAETCSGLRALDLVNVRELTDCSVQYITNGCRSIKALKLCRNAFSDKAIAAFLVASGESLTELSLNNVREVASNTAMALAAYCSQTLQSLDLSWCRKLKDEALGLIVDNCLSLRILKLFGCTHIKNVFLDGHSNPHVKIIGLKLSPLLDV
ncbi:DNA repair protein rhp7-like [Tasmannia lanceolata]|uniref:DNA repair protein rhp7-like n=1 Tax=Tasmannia lanceolata TaxID=3420 RepID=UPI004063EE15